MTREVKITIWVVVILAALLIVNYLTKGALPFYILTGVGFLVIVGLVFYYADTTKSQITTTSTTSM